jgi:hypothetical protein
MPAERFSGRGRGNEAVVLSYGEDRVQLPRAQIRDVGWLHMDLCVQSGMKLCNRIIGDMELLRALLIMRGIATMFEGDVLMPWPHGIS